MATSSITKNFVISGQEQVDIFADAIEASANDHTPPLRVSANFLTDPKDIANFMRKRKKTDAAESEKSADHHPGSDLPRADPLSVRYSAEGA